MKIRRIWYFFFILSSFLIVSYSILDISLTFAQINKKDAQNNKKDHSLFSSLSRDLDKTMDGTQNNALTNNNNNK